MDALANSGSLTRIEIAFLIFGIRLTKTQMQMQNNN